ncbi:MAG: type II toxin-antitoxin system VapC family toxin [Planctomycetaceae bacterium]|nr:type II toxin-antitoxin system VapC family toxin [Planctomycetaceae bacterium]
MILLDTQMWLWWVINSPRLKPRNRELIEAHTADGLGVSQISAWEIAKKHSLGKLGLDQPIDEWMAIAMAYPGIQLLPLTLDILVEATRLPGGFRSDPGDEMIVATSRVLGIPLLTADDKLLNYEHDTKLT